MMKSLIDFNSIIYLFKTHIKNFFLDYKKLILLLLLLSFFIFSLYIYLSSESSKPLINITTDDKSIEMSLIINGFTSTSLNNYFRIEKVDRKIAKYNFDNNKSSYWIDLPDNLIEQLENNPPALVKTYSRNKEFIKNIIDSYVKTVIDFVNSTQESSMIYWNAMKDKGLSFDERLNELKSISYNILKVFSNRDLFVKTQSLRYLSIYKYISILTFTLLLYLNMGIIDDKNTGRFDRLLISSYSKKTYFASWYIFSSIFTTIISMIFYLILKPYISINLFFIFILILVLNLLSLIILCDTRTFKFYTIMVLFSLFVLNHSSHLIMALFFIIFLKGLYYAIYNK